MDIESIGTDGAPKAIGPYSQGVIVAGVVFCSGQIALSPATGEMVGTTAAEQTRQVLANLDAVLRAGNSNPGRVVKTTIYLKNLADFAAVNEVYGAFFGSHRPARATVEVARLPKDGLVEIDCIALAEEKRF
jgi:2-iminobutanoate/2-iminopropanoate deaminase